MKKSLLLLCLVFLVGKNLVAGSESAKAEILFSKGLTLYNEKEYQQAEKIFSRLLSQHPGHRNSLYFLGMSRFHQEQFEQAVASFNILLAEGGSEAEPYLYRGVSLYRLERKEEALTDLKKSYDLAEDKRVRELARSYLRLLEEGETKEAQVKRWFVNGHLKTLYDTNVSLNPDDVTITALPTDQSDIQFGAGLGGGYHLLLNDRHRLTAKGSYQQSLYSDIDALNYGLASVKLEPFTRWDRFSAGFPVGYQFSLLGREKYLSRVEAGPEIKGFFGTFMPVVSLRGSLDNFFQTLTSPTQDRDARNLQAEFSPYLLGDGGAFFRVTYLFEKNWADGDDWDFRSHAVGTGLTYPLAGGVDLSLKGEVTLEKRFDKIDSVLGERREDLLQILGGGLSRRFGHFEIAGHYDFYRNSSTLEFFSYHRHLAGVTLATSF